MKKYVFLLALGLSAQAWAKSAFISAFSPQNLSETTNQIRVVFSDKMIALGANPDADIFDVSCSPQMSGRAHWDDDKTWTYDFSTKLYANKLPGGTRCQVTLKTGVKTLAGALVTGRTSFKFQVDGPNIIAIYPGDTNGQSSATVAEDQVFALGLDANVDENTLLKNVYFKVEGVASPIQIRILSEGEKRSLEKADNFPSYMFSQDLPLVMIQAKDRFPEGKKVSLVWGAGIRSSESGLSRTRTLVLPFESRKMLEATFTCTRENAKAGCSPFSDMELDFSAEIPADMANQIRLVTADGKTIKPHVDKSSSSVSSVAFPAQVKENQSYRIELPSGIKDVTGRPLANQKSYPLTVKTSDFPPLAKFAADFGVIEANQKPVLLPATLRNLEAQVIGQKFAPANVQGAAVRVDSNNFPAVVQWMKNLEIKSQKAQSFKDRDRSILNGNKAAPFNIPLKSKGKAFEVVGIPLGGPGFYVVELQSRVLGRSLLGKNTTMYVPTGALVTNMVVHSKWGKENSVFWVTALDSGLPVPGAQVTVYDCAGRAIQTLAPTDANGLTKYTGDLKAKVPADACKAAGNDPDQISTRYDNGFFVGAQKGGDFTFTHSSWTDGIEYWRFGSEIGDTSPADASDNVIAHTVLDRTLFHAGETVSMKHFMRAYTTKGIGLMAAQSLPTQARIVHSDSGTAYTADLKWDANGTALSSFVIPKDAKQGLYQISLVKDGGSEYFTSTFQVMDFKVPQMKGMIAFPAQVQKLVQPGSLDAQVSVTYQDGGPVPNKAVNFRYTVSRGYGVYYDAYPRMTFGGERIVEKHGRLQDQESENEKTIQVPLRLDSKGSAVVTIPGLSGLDSVKSVSTQLEFTDSNSEAQNVSRTVTVYPSGLLVGVAMTDGFASKQHMKFTVAVVDLKGNPVAGVRPNLEMFEQITYTHKTQMVGGFYSSESFQDINPVPANFNCPAATDAKGQMECTVSAPQSGDYIIQAAMSDSNGYTSYGSDNVYVRGKRRAWFPSDNNDRMDLIPAQTQVQAGHNATFQVKMPFAEATVLVTVEREGVLDSFVTTVNTSNPVIQVPIKPEYAPNVYISALAVRGRVAGSGAEETATVDLGKPAYKLGLAPLNVNWANHKLNVLVKPSKDVYKPREVASVDVTITGNKGQVIPNAEFALAVVDAGLLELAKNKTQDLLADMMGKRPLNVQTSTAQMQVIGKRHYGLKAKPTGGDGGSAPTRELFDTLVKWYGRVKTDANGHATVQFPMNDSLTKFEIVAIAHSGADKFGTGEASIVSQQDVVLIPGVAQTSRNGDSYDATFTVRNTTKSAQPISVGGRATFTYADGHTQTVDCAPQNVTLQPLDSQVVTACKSLKVPDGVVAVQIGVAAQKSGSPIIDPCVDKNASAIDKICIKQAVNPAVLTRTWMAQLSHIDRNLAPINVNLPAQALPNRGGVKVDLMSTLGAGLATVKEDLSQYRFVSLESLVSSAVVNGDQAIWDSAMKRLPSQMDQEGFAMFYPSLSSTQGSDMLTAYILSMSAYSGFKIPSDQRAKMVDALKNFVEGRAHLAGSRGKQDTATDIFVRRVNAIEVLARLGQAQPAWLTSLPSVASQQLPTSTLIELVSTYETMRSAPARATKLDQYQSAIRLRLTRVGTGLKFTDDQNACFCLSSTDSEQNRLILVLSSNPELAKAWSGETPNIVQAAATMMNRGAWTTTVADAYGVLAMRAFTKNDQAVTGITNVTFNSSATKSFDWSTGTAGVLDFGWPGAGTYAVDLKHQGTGAPWAIVAVKAAVPLTQKVEQHIQLTKTVSPQKTVYKVGDEVTVTLTIKAQTSLQQVSLVDPIPSGAKIEGSGLDNDASTGPQGDLYPDYEELANDGYHASYGYVPAEGVQVVYKMRLNNAGTFKLPTTRIEAVYAPENFAEAPNADITVQP